MKLALDFYPRKNVFCVGQDILFLWLLFVIFFVVLHRAESQLRIDERHHRCHNRTEAGNCSSCNKRGHDFVQQWEYL